MCFRKDELIVPDESDDDDQCDEDGICDIHKTGETPKAPK